MGRKVRFAIVGILNTAIDFGVLFALKYAGVPVIPANVLSTSVAFCFSFFANKNYTFKSTGTDIKREIILFVAVTLFGIWVLQGAVIYIIRLLLSDTSLTDNASLLLAKIIATGVSLIWNYLLYSRVVFKKSPTASQKPQRLS